MAKPHIWIHYARPRSAWYNLDDSEKDQHMEHWFTVKEASVAGGAQEIGRYHVRGQSDFSIVEVWHFPDADAAFDHWSKLTVADYSEWFTSHNNIGFAMDLTAERSDS